MNKQEREEPNQVNEAKNPPEPGKPISEMKASEYDIIAFDMDLCIAEYNVNAFNALKMHSDMLQIMQKLNYPKEIYPTQNEQKDPKTSLANFFIRGFIDKSNFLVLKIGEDLKILMAYNGYKRLSFEEIREIYGPGAKINQKDIDERKFFVVSNFFQSSLIYVVIRIAELRRTNRCQEHPKLKDLTCEQLIEDLYSVIIPELSTLHNERCLTEYMINPSMLSTPDRFFKPLTPEFKTSIEKLREKGKIVVVVTNSPYFYADKLLEFICGDGQKGYLNHFDYIIANSKKPKFFTEELSRDLPIHKIDLKNKENFVDLETVQNLDFDFDQNRVSSGGSLKRFVDFLKKNKGLGDGYRGLYLGDNPVGDMEARKEPEWDTCFVYKELSLLTGEWDREWMFDSGGTWGSQLYGLDQDGGLVKCYFFDKAVREFGASVDSVLGDAFIRFLKR